MRTNYIFSAVALFLLAAFLGIWLCSLLLGKTENDIPADPPMSVSQPQGVSAGLGSDAAPPAVFEEPFEEPREEVNFSISADKVYPGEYIVIYAYNAAPEDIEVISPFSRAPRFFEVEDHLAALLPVKYTYEPGEYVLSVQAKGLREQFAIELLPKEWPTQHLTVDPSVTSQTIDNSAANYEYSEKAQPKKELFEPSPLWSGSFIQPVQGNITTEFGMQRTVNGVVGDRHGGVDISAAKGTPVLAANSGKVIFAEYIALTGNTVCIEHGLGLKTWYYHMDSLSVEPQQVVEQGQQIGTVGSTGFSTGPHLHWAAAVFDVYINPWSLIDSAPEL